ncbi:hypothetical protein PCYB_006770 [Plasmodium cynomolgi strain B]|uniref:CYIR protein n=1 Tax=Plasmodium cynomolgi (strain B) TaxID=1120755 RepID=K6UNY9_PLACD|nr:hypothetical protein PCYB_006770 [Plasmodium cynomolgi strain B]GAB69928.1 hypothetical protein PCYB_006770 [Plasmodium cynomolgi strain B]
MYYWLYVDVLNREPSHTDTIELYKDLINQHDSGSIFQEYKNQFNEKKSENLIKLFTLYKNFNKVEIDTTSNKEKCGCAKECATTYMGYIDLCHNGNDQDFCNELKNFRVRYNNHIKSIENCNAPKELPSFQGSSLAATISIPVSIMSVISFFSFITYKVASWINHTLMKKKRSFNELLQASENNSNRGPYNIAYSLSE